jgi:hypothetical protein
MIDSGKRNGWDRIVVGLDCRKRAPKALPRA